MLTAADFARKHLRDFLVNHELFRADTEAALHSAFLRTDKEFTEYATKLKINGGVGTTATVALILDNKLYVANLGDSDAFICTKGEKWIDM